MKKMKKIGVISLIVLLCAIGAGLFFFRNKEFSFQKIEKDAIREIAFSVRDDFYCALSEGEMEEVYENLKEISWEDSGIEDVELKNGVKIRLTMKNGEKIFFQGSGHTLFMEGKAYYVEGNALSDIESICDARWKVLKDENEKRTDFSDINEDTVYGIKVYEGISLCYALNEKEQKEILKLLNSLELGKPQEAKEESAEWRYQIEKKDGFLVEFSVDEEKLVMNGREIPISNKDGNFLKEKHQTWLQAVREQTRQMPFRDFKESEIKCITVHNPAWNMAKELTEEERKELLGLLSQIILTGTGTKDYEEREGLIVEAFQLEKKDGTKIAISANQDPFIINGKGYVIENKEVANQLINMYSCFNE